MLILVMTNLSGYDLHARIAVCLGWTENEVKQFSLATVGELVCTKDPALYDEICLVREQGLHLTDPVRDPRRVPMPDMSWLANPPTEVAGFKVLEISPVEEPAPITINRSKLYPTPGRNYRVAWKWLYEVTVPGESHPFVGEGIGWARGIAKRFSKATGRKVVLLWEKK